MRRVLGRHNTCVEQRLRIGIDTQMLEQLDRGLCVMRGRRFCLRNVQGIVRLFGRREIQFAELKTKQRRIGNDASVGCSRECTLFGASPSSFSGLDRHVLVRCWRVDNSAASKSVVSIASKSSGASASLVVETPSTAAWLPASLRSGPADQDPPKAAVRALPPDHSRNSLSALATVTTL